MAQEKLVEELRALADTATETKIDSLIRHADWGAINFEKAKPDLERLFQMMEPVKVMPVEMLPDNLISHVINALRPIVEIVKHIKNFDIQTTENPGNRRDSLCNDLRSHLDSLYPHLTPHIPYLAYVRGDVAKNVTALSDALANTKRMYDEAQVEIQIRKNAVDEIIAAAREASASVGVAHFTADFSAEAKTLAKTATKWLVATGVTAFATAAVAIIWIWALSEFATTQEMIQRLVSKVVVLGLLFTATVWCGRMYKAAMHQATINRHRANALKTFQAFTKAAADDASRDAVLMETTRSIFAITPSGYLDGSDSGADGGTKIIEVVKGASQAAAAAGKAGA